MYSLIIDSDEKIEFDEILELKEKYLFQTIYTYQPYLYDSFCIEQAIELKEIKSSKDYSTFRKTFYYQLEKCFTNENNILSEIFETCKYHILFDNERLYHKIWLIEEISKIDNNKIIFFSDKSDLTSKERKEVFSKKEIITYFKKSPLPHFKSEYFKYLQEHIYRLKNFKIYKSSCIPVGDKEIFFIENIDNNIKVAKWFKEKHNLFSNRTAIINTNQYPQNLNYDINFYSLGTLNYVLCLLKAEFLFYKIKLNLKFKTFNNNKQLKVHILNTLRPMVFESIYFKKYFNEVAQKTKIKYAISTNFASIYSRVATLIFKKKNIKTLYLQHGLLETENYATDILQDYINVWGNIYLPYLKKKDNIILGNVLDFIKNEKPIVKEAESNNSSRKIKKVLFLPSRTGGNIVTVSDNKQMFDTLINAICHLNKTGEKNTYQLVIKLHPNDAIGEKIFYTDKIQIIVTKEYDSKYWISNSDICIASNSTAGTEVCFYLKPFIYFQIAKTVSIIDTYDKYKVGIGIKNTSEMINALEKIENQHKSEYRDNMIKFNQDFAQNFEIEKFEELLSK